MDHNSRHLSEHTKQFELSFYTNIILIMEALYNKKTKITQYIFFIFLLSININEHINIVFS